MYKWKINDIIIFFFIFSFIFGWFFNPLHYDYMYLKNQTVM